MDNIPLPNLKTISNKPNLGVFEISPLNPGYGQTIANTLRRVLLSSIVGTAVDSISIEGVDHEFSTITGIKEDVVEITLNLKAMPVKLNGQTEEAKLTLEKSKAGPITASDFAKNADVEVIDPDHYIATLDKGGKFNLTIIIKRGRGYQTIEQKEHKKEIGLIVVDSFFSPIKHVEYNVENTRVGQDTNYDKILLTIETDGTVDPKESLEKSAQILTEHYALLAQWDMAEKLAETKKQLEEKIEAVKEEEKEMEKEVPVGEPIKAPVDPKTKIEDTDLSGRTQNALLTSGLKTVSGLKRMPEIKLAGVRGLGAKGLQEVKDLLVRVED